MSGPGIGFKRMVIGLPQGPVNQAAVDASANLAEFLNIELLATFVADSTLPALAGLSGAREFRALEQGWQAIDRAQITRDIDLAISIARRRFTESVRSRTIKTSFDVLTRAEAIASLIRVDDIVAVIEPAHPGEMITRQFTGLLEAAFEMAGAVLVVPARIARTIGPIVTVAADLDDPGIRAALEIAAALKERLIIVTAADTRPPIKVLADAEQLGVQVEHIAGSGPSADASSLAASAPLRERLRVLTRSSVLTDDAARLFSSLQGIPLLVIEPSRAGAAGKERETEKDHQAGRSGG
jgi:hypothetical protein